MELTVADLYEDTKADFVIHKLYYLLCDNKVIRNDTIREKVSDAIIDCADEDLDERKIKEGTRIYSYYISESSFSLFRKKKVKLYTVNWVFNAIISGIQRDENGIKTIRLKDNATNPMFVSYSGFLSKEAANDEIDGIFERKDIYYNAETFEEMLEKDLYR